jgi:4-diphosphocytidyl-2-C-methyl-D-erythritol kinase
VCRSPEIEREDVKTSEFADALPTDDLCTQAARLLKAHTGVSLGARIALEKRIPQQAGMGGGSSDAATCLIALNRLWNTGLKRQDLMSIGAQLGADVPFFIHGTDAWVEGTGESIQSIDHPPHQWVVVKPNTGAETQKIFSDPHLKRNTKRVTMQGFAEYKADTKNGQCAWFGDNDLQPVAVRLVPEISECLGWMKNQGLSPRMTGSGSAAFAPWNAAQKLSSPPQTWWIKRCNSVGVHPLKDWVAD